MSPPILLTTLGTLAQPSGMGPLQEQMRTARKPLSDDQLHELGSFLQHEFGAHPNLESTRIRVGPTGSGGGAYLPQQDIVSVDDPNNTSILAHELGHAQGMKSSGSVYRALQNISRKLWKTNLYATLPAIGAVAALMEPGAARLKALDRLAMISAGLSAPVLIEEASASLDALKQVPDKLDALRYTVPGFLSYAVPAAASPLLYLGAKRLLRG